MINPDEENLRVIALFQYVVGGLGVVCACIPLIHITIGLMMVSSSGPFAGMHGDQPPALFGWFFVVIGGLFFVMGQCLAVCMIIAGRSISRRGNYSFVFVVACLECLLVPFGTILGVFTIITLSRESVKALFSGR